MCHFCRGVHLLYENTKSLHMTLSTVFKFLVFCSPSVFCVFAPTSQSVGPQVVKWRRRSRKLSNLSRFVQMCNMHLCSVQMCKDKEMFIVHTMKYPGSLRHCKSKDGRDPRQCDNHQSSTTQVAIGVRVVGPSKTADTDLVTLAMMVMMMTMVTLAMMI